MRASLQSDVAYANGDDPSYFDAEATRLKRRFVAQFAPIADAQGLPQYSDGDF
jgi:hypothetical protein